MKRKFWNWVRNEGEKRILLLDGEISDETWMNAKKVVELGFADSVLYTDAQRPVTDTAGGLIFSRAAVTNSLLSKFGQGTQANNVDAEPLKRRLFSISH